ncbi:MAG: hypothetical protein Q9175_004276 [Cornicularia normoerica]
MASCLIVVCALQQGGSVLALTVIALLRAPPITPRHNKAPQTCRTELTSTCLPRRQLSLHASSILTTANNNEPHKCRRVGPSKYITQLADVEQPMVAFKDYKVNISEIVEEIHGESQERTVGNYETSVQCVQDVLLHNVLCVTLNSSEVYALDMTAAQHGWHESAVMPGPTFFEKKVEIIQEIRNFRETARVLKAEAEAAGGQGINEHMEEGVNNDLREYQRNDTAFEAMLRCSEEELMSKQHLLLGFMNERMSIFKVDVIKVES